MQIAIEIERWGEIERQRYTGLQINRKADMQINKIDR